MWYSGTKWLLDPCDIPILKKFNWQNMHFFFDLKYPYSFVILFGKNTPTPLNIPKSHKTFVFLTSFWTTPSRMYMSWTFVLIPRLQYSTYVVLRLTWDLKWIKGEILIDYLGIWKALI